VKAAQRFPVPHVYQPRILGSRLSRGARLVALALAGATDGATCATSYQPIPLAWLATRTAYSRRACCYYLRELEREGYVRSSPQFGADRSQGPNLYALDAVKFGGRPALARTDREPNVGPLELEARAAASAELVRALELSPAKTARRA